MPTAARLVAALALAAFSAATALVFLSYWPELKRSTLQLVEVSAVVGALIGWSSLGMRAGEGLNAAMGYGLRSSAHTAAWIILLVALYRVFNAISYHAYQEPMDAVQGVFDNAIRFLGMSLKLGVIATAAVLGPVAGILMELSSRVWK